MTRYPLKPILIGIVAGIAFFVMPFFLLRVFLFILIIGGLFRFFAGRRSRWQYYHGYGHHGYGHHGYGRGLHPAFTDTIRHMTDEEYKTFRQSLANDQPSYQYKREIPITEDE